MRASTVGLDHCYACGYSWLAYPLYYCGIVVFKFKNENRLSKDA